jgi:LAGLIDADG-like domain
VILAPVDEQRQILSSMWQGDGSRFRRKTRAIDVSTYTTSSYYLALQVHEMLLRRGEVYGIHATKITRYSTGNAYQVRKESGGSQPLYEVKDGILWTPVARVGNVESRETFNLTVDGEPNYRTGSCLVHNCGAFASPGEYERIRHHCPDVADEIDRLAVIAKECGKHAVWGTRPGKEKGVQATQSGPLCSSCDLRAKAAGIEFKACAEGGSK